MIKEKIVKRTISDFLNVEYLRFSLYTVAERAIPSICDGLKPGARKIVHAACTGALKTGKTNKMITLVGDTMKLSQYSHGDASLIGTVCTLSRDFSNNFNPLEIEGQGGNLRDPDPGAPRYLYIRNSKFMDLIYKVDYDLLNFVFEEGDYVEPEQYFPIIPTVLCNMSMGIANGYSFHSMAYHPIDIIEACKELLKSKKELKNFKTNIRPYIRGIKQSNFKYQDGVWYNYGEWKTNQSKDLLTITDLPCDMTYVDIEKILNKFCDSGYIKDYQNKSEDGNVLIEVKFNKNDLSKQLKKEEGELKLANKFKLIKQLPDDLLWLLNEKNKLKYYDNKYEVIKYFVNWRLTIYEQRKKKLVKILNERLKKNEELARFIELVCKGKLKIRNRNKKDIKLDMDGFKLPIELISTPMSKCTVEERDELLKKNEELRKEIEYIKNTTERQMYINDLDDLKKNIEKEFK
jgi:DNA topoisomerase-2